MEIDQQTDDMEISEESKNKQTAQSITDTPFVEYATKLRTLIQEKAPAESLHPVYKSLIDSFCSTVSKLYLKKSTF